MEEKGINIDKDLALAMTTAYENRRNLHRQDMPGENKDDTKYVYIPIKKLMTYLKKNSNASGLRVYFGVIDDHKIPSDPNYRCNQKFKKQTTVILKATNDSSFLGESTFPLIAMPINQTPDYESLDDFDICPPATSPDGTCNNINED